MRRRDFFKATLAALAGLAVAPFVRRREAVVDVEVASNTAGHLCMDRADGTYGPISEEYPPLLGNVIPLPDPIYSATVAHQVSVDGATLADVASYVWTDGPLAHVTLRPTSDGARLFGQIVGFHRVGVVDVRLALPWKMEAAALSAWEVGRSA